VGFRDVDGELSCVMGIGSEAWDRLIGSSRPAGLHPFREIRAGTRHAVATPGDLLFHIRARRMDLCFELATRIMARPGDAVAPADEVHGCRYFDDRDLLGFVDGTKNPTSQEAIDATLIGDVAGRCSQAELGAQRADDDRRGRHCATTCPSGARRRASSAPISWASPARRG
jgi:putative iron-dependent peroxidase